MLPLLSSKSSGNHLPTLNDQEMMRSLFNLDDKHSPLRHSGMDDSNEWAENIHCNGDCLPPTIQSWNWDSETSIERPGIAGESGLQLHEICSQHHEWSEDDGGGFWRKLIIFVEECCWFRELKSNKRENSRQSSQIFILFMDSCLDSRFILGILLWQLPNHRHHRVNIRHHNHWKGCPRRWRIIVEIGVWKK